MDPVHPILTKFGMNILIDPRNKPADEFLIFLELQHGGLPSKVQNRPNLTPQINISARHLDPVHLIWTKIGMVILIDISDKRVEAFFFK